MKNLAKNRSNLGFGLKALLLVAVSFGSQAQQLDAIDQAARQNNSVQLQQLSQQSTDAYGAAYSNYRLAVAAAVQGDEATLKPALMTAAEQLDTLLQGQPEQNLQVEALALLASVRGMQAGYYPIKGAYYGKLSADAMAAARQLQPENPRVLLVGAILAFQTPAWFGGDKKAALQQADAAVTAFAAPCQHICWGKEEAYVWRGLAKQDTGDKAGAQADWQQALQLSPDYQWPAQLLQRQ